jgi:hypothetical protein
MSQIPEGRDETFRRLYAEHFDAVLGFALRRADRPEDAADVTAEFAQAKDAGSESRMAAAVAALQTSKHWPILLEMDERGDYAEVLWQYADEVPAGSVPEGYRQGLGC